MESIRSRKAIALLLLYVAGSLGATGIFLRVVRVIENTLADTLSVARTQQPGTMTATLFESKEFMEFLGEWVGDDKLAAAITSMPPLVLFYAGLALMFIPLLAVLSSCDAVSYEVATGSARFALFRTDRLSWVLGKFLGQAILMACGIFSGAIACYILGAFFMSSFKPALTAVWMARMSARVWVYGFAYLGLALGVSQLTRSVNWSRALALIAWAVIALAGALLAVPEIVDWSPMLIQNIHQILPAAHRLDLWRPDLIDRLPGTVMLLCLGALYFSIGYIRFVRRDG